MNNKKKAEKKDEGSILFPSSSENLVNSEPKVNNTNDSTIDRPSFLDGDSNEYRNYENDENVNEFLNMTAELLDEEKKPESINTIIGKEERENR